MVSAACEGRGMIMQISISIKRSPKIFENYLWTESNIAMLFMKIFRGHKALDDGHWTLGIGQAPGP